MNIMKIFSLIFALLLLGNSRLIFAQDTSSSGIKVNFTVPKGWEEKQDSVFILKDFNKEFAKWYQALSNGHMPWRVIPKYVAVTCLWNFGIKDGTPVSSFANRLIEIKKGEVYSLNNDSKEYFIYIKSMKSIPIAYKLIIKHSRNSKH